MDSGTHSTRPCKHFFEQADDFVRNASFKEIDKEDVFVGQEAVQLIGGSLSGSGASS